MTVDTEKPQTQDEEEPFDPSKRTIMIGDAEYLQVRDRIVWFRREHPRGSIETFLMEHKPGEYAVFKCEVRIPHPDNPFDGRWIDEADTRATGWGDESHKDFHEYLTKGESKSIGRALALLGFGTASLPDDGDRLQDLADTPIQRAPHQQPRQAQPQRQPRQSRQPQAHEGRPQMRDPGGAATEAQVNAIIKIAARKQITDIQLMEYVEQTYRMTLDSLTKGAASEIIQLIGDQSFTGFGGAANGSATGGKSDDDLPLEKSAF